jgi:hypothetical protein
VHNDFVSNSELEKIILTTVIEPMEKSHAVALQMAHSARVTAELDRDQLQKRVEELEFKTSLEGYRAMGAQVAAALDERDQLRQQVEAKVESYAQLWQEYEQAREVVEKLLPHADAVIPFYGLKDAAKASLDVTAATNFLNETKGTK